MAPRRRRRRRPTHRRHSRRSSSRRSSSASPRTSPRASSAPLSSASLCHRRFHRRLHELHGRAPVLPSVLGFLQNAPHVGVKGFVTATASAFSIAVPVGQRYGQALDFRHGRALLLCGNDDLVVWDPIAGDQRLVFGPDEVTFCDAPAAAVVCAADGCDHHGCHGEIIEYDLARCSMARISPAFEGKAGIHLILTEDGGLGAAESFLDSTSIHIWSGDVSDHINARWTKSRVIRLDNALPHAALSSTSLKLMGFAEGANTILFRTADGVFTIELRSEQARKLCEDGEVHTLVPIARFYTPPPTTLERAKQLFDRGFQAIQKGDFVNALDFLSHAIKIRVARYGKFSPECDSRYYKYGCALKETQGVSDPLFNVPKCAPNEQSVKSTTCKDDTVNSKAPRSNMEDSSPLKKGDFEEGQNSDEKDQEDGSSDSDYDDDNISGDESDSDIDLAWEMLDIARALVEKSSGTTMEDVKILSALAEVCLKRDDVDDSLCYYRTALDVLEHLVEHDDRRIVELNFCICSVLEVKPKIRDAIRYCAKSITLCKSRIQNLKNAREAMLADKGDSASAAEGGSVKSTLEDEMVCLAGILAELEKKLEELEQAMSSQAMSDSETTSGHRIRAKLNLGCVWFMEQD